MVPLDAKPLVIALAFGMFFTSGCRRADAPRKETIVKQGPALRELSWAAKVTPAISPVDPVESTSLPEQRNEVEPPPISNNRRDQLRDALARYQVADEETRTNIAENLSQFAEDGFPKSEIARALGMMFATENSIHIKCSILNELYHLEDPCVLEYVATALLPNQAVDVRDEAISVLQDIGDKRAVTFLRPLLAEADDNIREEAHEAIESISQRR